MAQASVFEGGFTLEAAEAVLDHSPWPDAPSAMDAVQALVDKSLHRTWVPVAHGRYDIDEPYFGMYVSIHEYAREKLKASGPGAELVAAERHGRYFASFGTEEALEALFRHGGVRRRRALALELDNLVAACRRAVARGDGETAVETYRAAWEVLELQGPFALGVVLGTQVLTLDGISSPLRAAALVTRALASWRAGRMEEAGSWFAQALALSNELRDRRREGSALGHLGGLHRDLGWMEEARKHLEAALAIAREEGDHRFEGMVLGSLGTLHFEQGRMEEARAHYEAALAIHREVGNRSVEGVVLGNLGILHNEQGRVEEAWAYYEAALAIHREVGDRRFEGIVLRTLGELNRDQARVEDARAHFDAALAIAHGAGDRRSEGIALRSLADLLVRQGRNGEAREAFQAGEALLRDGGYRTELAKLLCIRGRAEVAAGDLDAARSALGEAETVAAAIGAGPNSDLCREIAKLREALV